VFQHRAFISKLFFMGSRNISTKLLKARKDHHDDSFNWIEGALPYIRSSGKLSFTELRAIAESIKNGWLIKKGQIYERQYNEQDGTTYTFKTLPAIGKICQKLDLYQC
jgi:hypothetical protein